MVSSRWNRYDLARRLYSHSLRSGRGRLRDWTIGLPVGLEGLGVWRSFLFRRRSRGCFRNPRESGGWRSSGGLRFIVQLLQRVRRCR